MQVFDAWARDAGYEEALAPHGSYDPSEGRRWSTGETEPLPELSRSPTLSPKHRSLRGERGVEDLCREFQQVRVWFGVCLGLRCTFWDFSRGSVSGVP